MTAQEYIAQLRTIGWFEHLCYDYSFDSKEQDEKELIEQLSQLKDGQIGVLLLTEACFDEENLYELYSIVEVMVYLSKGDLVESDIEPIWEQKLYFTEAESLFEHINQILIDKGIQKRFYILPRVDQMVFYVYKPEYVFEQALEKGLIVYEEKANIDFDKIEIAPIDAVFFEVDNTLFQNIPDITRIIKKMCQLNNWSNSDSILSDTPSSLNSLAIVKRLINHNSIKVNDEQLEVFHKQFFKLCLEDIKLHSQIFYQLYTMFDVLEYDYEKPWGIITRTPKYIVELLLDSTSLQNRCSIIVCFDDISTNGYNPSHTTSDSFYGACEELGVSTTHCVYASHRKDVLEISKETCMLNVLTDYENKSNDFYISQDSHIDIVINSPNQLSDFVIHKLQ